jgi:pimeloyl-ACP methyl ester carboxylesterase
MPSFKSRGLDLAFDDEGEGRPILLVHGFGSNARVNWREPSWFTTLTGAGYRVVAIDNRGHGRSGAPHDPAAYSIPVMAEDARALLDHLGIVQAAVMGYSMGASIATWLTLEHPERVGALILGGLASRLVEGVGGHEDIARALEADEPPADASPKARSYRAFADQTKSDGKALAACMRGIRQPVRPDALAEIACPVLVVAGELDEVAGPVDDLVAMIPGARGVVLPRRNHMNAVGDRGYKQAVLAFLAGLN